MTTKPITTKDYALADLDTSRLPPPVQEQLSRRWEGTPSASSDKPLTHIYGHPGPYYNEKRGTYHQTWVLSSGSIIEDGYWACMVTSPWISPPIEQFLENIRTDK